jgi:hypothetical protein
MLKRRDAEIFSLSFLDCISCGFGAVILLLVLSKFGEPIVLEQSRVDLEGRVIALEREAAEIRGETTVLNRDLKTRVEQLAEERRLIARLQGDLSDVRGKYRTSTKESEVVNDIEGQLVSAKQDLTEEMKRLLGRDFRRSADDAIGGIPVDSEYIIFIIDTSGSMKRYEWDRVQQQITETLDVYPTVKGIQVINDEGNHMFLATAGTWMQDTPQRRRAIIEELEDWDAFSNSSPRRGILRAIDQYYDPNNPLKISLYVYSDDFSSGASAVNAVIREVDARNRANEDGERLVRIHAVAFPVYWDVTGTMGTGGEYAKLMRILCQRNGGTFVALPSRRSA